MSYFRLSVGRGLFTLLVLAVSTFLSPIAVHAQTGNAGTIAGAVKDPSGAAIPGADVTIANPISGYQREAKTDVMGQFRFPNIPFNPYHLTVTATGFTWPLTRRM